MKKKFTPGPWIVDFDLCDEEGPLDVPEVNGRILDQDNCVACQASTEANVFLIAAAPEMYEALKADIAEMEQVAGKLGKWAEWDDFTKTLYARIDAARALLAKIEGEGA